MHNISKWNELCGIFNALPDELIRIFTIQTIDHFANQPLRNTGHLISVSLQESCTQYWPNEDSSQFEEFTVTLVDKEGTPGFVIRKFVVESSKVCHISSTYQKKIVIKFHFCISIVNTNISSDPVPCDQLVS